MQITHAEAHKLIQFNLDRALNLENQKMLFAHLQECESCRAYTDAMLNVENTLRLVMNKQWQFRPLPLWIGSIKSQKNTHPLFQLRTALISIVLVVFSFFIWELTAVYDSAGQTASNVPPVPTPSIQISTASIEAPKCKWSLHKVDHLDTLETIAYQYSVSKEDIVTFNNMSSDVIYESMEIKIPQCDATPTVTANMPTTTLTPILELSIDTPG